MVVAIILREVGKSKNDREVREFMNEQESSSKEIELNSKKYINNNNNMGKKRRKINKKFKTGKTTLVNE